MSRMRMEPASNAALTTYVKHEDPGHGWLEVEKSELRRLGIASEISFYSYMDDDDEGLAWLEEDCDLAVFAKAKADAGELWDIAYQHTNADHWIRSRAIYQN